MGAKSSWSRGLAALAALGVVVTLAGCSLVSDAKQVLGIAGEEAELRDALASLVDQLRGMPGVEDVAGEFSSVTAAGRTAAVTVDAIDDATTGQLIDIAEAARTVFGNSGLAEAQFSLAVDIGDSTVRQSAFGMGASDLAADVVFWRTAESVAAAPLALVIAESMAGYPYERMVIERESLPISLSHFVDHFSELAEVDDETTSFSQLTLPGLQSVGQLPPLALVQLIPSLDREVGLIGANATEMTTGATIRWNSLGGANKGAEILINDLDAYTSENAAAVASVARALALTSIADLSIRIANQETSSTVHFESCTAGTLVNEQDVLFYQALLEAGVPLSVGAGAGWCERPAG